MSALDFNPREVLDHLHELGYTNITADQLKEFIKDLKKLIKYDQRMKESKRIVEGNQRGTCDDDSEDDDEGEDSNRLRVPNSNSRRVVSPMTSELAGENMRRRTNRSLQYDRDELIKSSQDGSHHSHSSRNVEPKQKLERGRIECKTEQEPRLKCRSASQDSNRSECQTCSDCKCKQTKFRSQCATEKEKNAQKCHQRPCSAKENREPTRSRSFIRPWKYQSHGPKPGYLSNRCDPVTLYHKYQALWQQNKIPGEETHSGLRWNIRERMLGQDPQPRPVSQASSLESMNRRGVSRM